MIYALFVVVGAVGFFAGYVWCWAVNMPDFHEVENPTEWWP